MRERSEQHSRVAARLESPAQRLELVRELEVVVDLPVESEREIAPARDHGLVPCRAEVEDRESAAAEREAVAASFCLMPLGQAGELRHRVVSTERLVAAVSV